MALGGEGPALKWDDLVPLLDRLGTDEDEDESWANIFKEEISARIAAKQRNDQQGARERRAREAVAAAAPAPAPAPARWKRCWTDVAALRRSRRKYHKITRRKRKSRRRKSRRKKKKKKKSKKRTRRTRTKKR